MSDKYHLTYGSETNPNDYITEPLPLCPICGREADTVYINEDGEVVGCTECITTRDAEEVLK